LAQITKGLGGVVLLAQSLSRSLSLSQIDFVVDFYSQLGFR